MQIRLSAEDMKQVSVVQTHLSQLRPIPVDMSAADIVRMGLRELMEKLITDADIQAAWERANPFRDSDPDDMREDMDEMPMCRELYGQRVASGWRIGVDGNAVACRMGGYPVMGDDEMSTAKVWWYWPTGEDSC